jgi:ABC-type transport system involved in multi-copper enzyme maturation permease subunit
LNRIKEVNKLGKGRPFLEVLSSALHEDYRFPFLELFAFLYALGTFVFASFGVTVTAQATATTSEAVAYGAVNSILSFPLFIFLILIFKNIAYGLGSDLEKGIIQTYFSYPLKRWAILTAKLLSALGVALLLFLGIQISALYILAPDIVLPQLGTVLMTYAASLSYPFLIAGIMVLLTLGLRRGGISLVVGIVLYFAMSIIQGIATVFAVATESPLGLQIISILSPGLALQQHYIGVFEFWKPAFSEVILYTGGSYVIVAFVFILGYIYFSRRLNL